MPMECTNDSPRLPIPLAGKVNVAVAVLFFVTASTYLLSPSDSTVRSVLDAPAAVSACAYFGATPLVALAERVASGGPLHRVTLCTLLAWGGMVLLLGVTTVFA